MSLIITLSLFLNFYGQSALAVTPPGLFELGSVLPLPLFFDDRYRIGDEWGKKRVTEEDLKSDPYFRRMALSTALLENGTGFYLGQFVGRYVFATNYHVCPDKLSCDGAPAVFTALNRKATLRTVLGSWPTIDLSLVLLDLSNSTAEALKDLASPFDFSAKFYRGQPLVTIGHGVADNPRRFLVANRDLDCRVFSGQDEFRLMADPDDLNPGPYEAWSFANGCDVSHGDSGSAMMDRETGKVLGIIWTGKMPKDPIAQSSEHLDALLKTPNEEIWTELSYGVPAPKMKEFLTEKLERGEIQRPLAVSILKEMLGL